MTKRDAGRWSGKLAAVGGRLQVDDVPTAPVAAPAYFNLPLCGNSYNSHAKPACCLTLTSHEEHTGYVLGEISTLNDLFQMTAIFEFLHFRKRLVIIVSHTVFMLPGNAFFPYSTLLLPLSIALSSRLCFRL